jgi:superfamily I DNA/RNA helicase
VRVSGSAGTGKTIVALHRAVHLARANPGARVVLTTFSNPLANALKSRLAYLISNEPAIAERITTRSITGIGHDLHSALFGKPNIASEALIRSLIDDASKKVAGHKLPSRFLFGEWLDIVDGWQLKTWEDYRDVSRLGRKTRVSGKRRELLWSIFEKVRTGLAERKAVTWPGVFGRLAEHFAHEAEHPFGYAVVDEAQDIGVAEARFLAAMAGGRRDGLFFTGDLGQRIFQPPFSWKSLGIDVRGRSFTLRVNYRTSDQIRSSADRLLPSSVSDVDGNAESRRSTVSIFSGPPPQVHVLYSLETEQAAVAGWIDMRLKEGCRPEEIGVFVRSPAQVECAKVAVAAAKVPSIELRDDVEVEPGKVAISTMHVAKGLEFRAVAVMACDDEVIPLQERIETVGDDADLQEVYDTERHLLYVACTRARDRLLVTGVAPGSEFLEDLLLKTPAA